MNRQVNLPTPAWMTVSVWDAPVVDALGQGPGGAYIQETRRKWIFEPPEFSSGPGVWRWAR